MSEFLLIKSFNEQAEEGEEQPVDTAFIEDRQGTPYLKAMFDVKHFKPEDVDVHIEDGNLVVTAQGVEDKEDRVYRKTLVRQIELPEQVNTDLMHTDITTGGLLSIEMPFKIREQPKPEGPNVFPIKTDPDGKRKIQLDIFVGTEFTDDEVKVESNGTHLFINAGYDAEIGKYGQQVRQREFKREYILPEYLQVDHVESHLDNGKLSIQIYLKDDKPYRCTITAEDLSWSSWTLLIVVQQVARPAKGRVPSPSNKKWQEIRPSVSWPLHFFACV